MSLGLFNIDTYELRLRVMQIDESKIRISPREAAKWTQYIDYKQYCIDVQVKNINDIKHNCLRSIIAHRRQPICIDVTLSTCDQLFAMPECVI